MLKIRNRFFFLDQHQLPVNKQKLEKLKLIHPKLATVLETARILSEYSFEYSILYCAFSAEEIGLIGSEAYASYCVEMGMDIVDYFNNTIIPFDYFKLVASNIIAGTKTLIIHFIIFL